MHATSSLCGPTTNVICPASATPLPRTALCSKLAVRPSALQQTVPAAASQEVLGHIGACLRAKPPAYANGPRRKRPVRLQPSWAVLPGSMSGDECQHWVGQINAQLRQDDTKALLEAS
eukprot:1157716-Pelagomonas_calceolata.AAC.3